MAQALLRTDYRPLDWTISNTFLNVSFQGAYAHVQTKLTLTQVNPEVTSVVLNGTKLHLNWVKVNGVPAKARLENLPGVDGHQLLHLDLSDFVAAGATPSLTEAGLAEVTLEVSSSTNVEENKSLLGIYRGDENALCSQCEAHGFRRITFYLDRPDNQSYWTVRVEGDKKLHPYLLSNGNCVEAGDVVVDSAASATASAKSNTTSPAQYAATLVDTTRVAVEGSDLSLASTDADFSYDPSQRHYAVWVDPERKPSYLFAVVAGEFDVLEDKFVTRSGRNVALKILARPGRVNQISFAMEALKRAFKWDEDRFNLEYDLDVFHIVAVANHQFGAMETTSLNIFNDSVLVGNKDTAEDAVLQRIDAIVAHEFFHHWTGNRVTLRDWFQLTLKEGLTVFRDQEYSSDLLDRTLERIKNVELVKVHQFEEDAGPTSHPIRPEKVAVQENFYTATVYNKGAEIIRAIHTLLGEEKFQQGCQLYFQRYKGQSVTCEHFVACMEEAGNLDLTHFKLWYSQSGTPEVHLDYSYNPETKVFKVTFKQVNKPTNDQQEKQPLYLPLKTHFLETGWVCEDTNITSYVKRLSNLKTVDGTLVPEVLVLDKPELTLELANVEEQPLVLTNLDFSAPVKVFTPKLALAQLVPVAVGSENYYARYEAVSQVYKDVYRENLEQYAQAQAANPDVKPNDLPVELPDVVLNMYQELLSQSFNQKGIYSLLLTFPTPATMLSHLEGQVDPLALQHVYQGVRAELCHYFKDRALSLFKLLPRDPWAYQVEQFGVRSLQRVLLDLITYNGEHGELVEDFYYQADNLTDRLTALRVNTANSLGLDNLPLDFLARYKNEPLVTEKYIGILALHGHTLEQALEGTKFSSYDPENSNRVRQVLGNLSNNFSLFYAKDRKAIDYLFSEVARLDKFSPGLASRCLGLVLKFHRFNTELRDYLVGKIAELGAGELSANTREKVDAALAMAKSK